MSNPPVNNPTADLPRCTDCMHYYITHEPRLPYGCHRLGFKSAQSPSRVVFQASGQPCLHFEQKLRRKGTPR